MWIAQLIHRISDFVQQFFLQLAIGLLVLLCVWASVFGLIQHEKKLAVEEIENLNNLLVRSFDEHVQRSIYTIDESLLLIKSEYESGGITSGIKTIMYRGRLNPLLHQILILDAAGYIVTSIVPGPQGVNFSDRDYFKTHADIDRQQLYISTPSFGRITNRPSIFLSRRLNTPTGDFAGVAMIAVDSGYFSKFYQDMGLHQGQLVRVIGRDGIVRASWAYGENEIGQNMLKSDLFETYLPKSPTGQYYTSGRAFGISRFLSYRSMENYPLIVQVGYGEKEALEKYTERQDLYVKFLFGTSIIIIILTGLSIISVRRQRKADDRWQLAVQGANDGIWDWDAQTGKTYYSDRWKQILGYEPHEIGTSQKEWASRVHPDDLEKVSQALADNRSGKIKQFDVTAQIRCKDGTYKWIRSRGGALRDDKGKVIRMAGSLTDIHMEKSAAEALRKSEQELHDSREKYKALIDQAMEAVALIDPIEMEIIEVNPRFTEWFGYSLPADAPLFIESLVVDGMQVQKNNADTLMIRNFLPTQRRTFKHKNGSLLHMERSATVVNIQEHQVIMATYRNIADQLVQEEALRRDLDIAGRIQHALLSRPERSEHVAVETVFRPMSDISGDMYYLKWRNEGLVLRGYLMDMPGHGLTTALYTSALNVLLHEVSDLDASLTEQLRWLNEQIPKHFGNCVKVSALAFEIDLQTRTFRYAGAGIHRFWAATATCSGPVEIAGTDLGNNDRLVEASQSMPLAVGDLLYFTTDGLQGLMLRHPNAPLDRFAEMVSFLKNLPEDSSQEGDTTAVCIRIKSLPLAYDALKWPKVVRLNGYGDYRRLKGDIAKILSEVTGSAHSMHEVAVNEAIANALECRDGQARNQKARVKINRIGGRLIVRVSTTRIGFGGNTLLRRLRASADDMFSFGETDTMGRGIPMMLSMSHWMTYNSEGTEVLLAWKIS